MMWSASKAELYGSLALTGIGHATDKAVILGLMGETPQDVVPTQVDAQLAAAELAGELKLLGTHAVPFKRGTTWCSQGRIAAEHPNGMRFTLTGKMAASSAKSTTRSAAASSRRLARRSKPRRSPAARPRRHSVPVRHHGTAAGARQARA
jgi:hypothetical protein